MLCGTSFALGSLRVKPTLEHRFKLAVVRSNLFSQAPISGKISFTLPVFSLTNQFDNLFADVRYFATKKPEKKETSKGKSKGISKKVKTKADSKSKSPAKKTTDAKKKVTKVSKKKETTKVVKATKKPKDQEKLKDKEQRAKERERKKKELEKSKEERRKEREKKAKEKEKISKEQAKEEKRRQKEEKELKPKRAASPYALFLKEQYPVVAKQNPDVGIGELAKKIAEKWADLNDRQKETYIQKSAQDRERWEAQMEAYKATLPPKKPSSSFILFAQANREAILKQHPNFSISQVTTELGKRWRKMSDSEKQQYANKAAKARDQYEDELAKWRAKHQQDDLD